MLHDLHRAIGPAETLADIARQRVRCEAAPERVVHIDAVITRAIELDTKFGILADAPFRPTTHALKRALAHHRHSAVLDDGVEIVSLHHADMEETGIFPVSHILECAFVAVAIILRRLHEADIMLVEIGNEGAQPVRLNLIVAVDDSDDFRVLRRSFKAEIERACLEARPVLQMEETELRSKLRAIIPYRLPH